MSGHSKWSTIKHQKAAEDKARSKAFSKASRAIRVAVREGGDEPDPEKNAKLRMAIEQAKEVDMPKENVERAIEKAMGKGRGELKSMRFEGYAPYGVGVIIEVITDNRQRTLQEIKNLLQSKGGSPASPGAVAYNFFPEGQVLVEKSANPEEQVLAIMDIAGVKEIDNEEELVEVISGKDQLAGVSRQLKEKGWEVESTNLIMSPKTEVPIKEAKKAQKLLDFVSALEDHDDVQAVFANFDIPREVLTKLD